VSPEVLYHHKKDWTRKEEEVTSEIRGEKLIRKRKRKIQKLTKKRGDSLFGQGDIEGKGRSRSITRGY